MDDHKHNVLIIGAGPSGLALAYELIKLDSNITPILIEKLSCAGGFARTIYDSGSGIDLGGHRLFTKDKYIESIWKKFLEVQNTPSIDDFLAHRSISYPKSGADPNFIDDVLLIRKRFSSIIQNGKIYSYPIRFGLNTFKNLGFVNSIKALCSYFKALIFRKKADNVENFLINRFGIFLYNLFFNKHSKKVWGIEPSQIKNDWQKTRVQRSLFALPALWEDEYYYPKYGCSQLWNKMTEYIIDNGGQVLFNCEFIGFKISDNRIISANVRLNGEIKEISADFYASSIPISELIKSIDAPYDIKQYALNLSYRDYILVNFYTTKFNLKNYTKFPTVNDITPDSWVYLQTPNTIASRMQIMNNWSPYLVEDFKNNYLISIEYFCNQNDELWNMSDYELTKLAISECERYNFFTRYDIARTKVIRELKAYPVYCGTYNHINEITEYIKKYKNLYLMGRCGLHKYINMDSAMVCGINIARDIIKRI